MDEITVESFLLELEARVIGSEGQRRDLLGVIASAKRLASSTKVSLPSAPWFGDLTLGAYAGLVESLRDPTDWLRNALSVCEPHLAQDEIVCLRELKALLPLPLVESPVRIESWTIDYLLATMRQRVVSSERPSQRALRFIEESSWTTGVSLDEFRVNALEELTVWETVSLVMELTSIYEILVEILRECWGLLSEEERRDLQEFLPALRR